MPMTWSTRRWREGITTVDRRGWGLRNDTSTKHEGEWIAAVFWMCRSKLLPGKTRMIVCYTGSLDPGSPKNIKIRLKSKRNAFCQSFLSQGWTQHKSFGSISASPLEHHIQRSSWDELLLNNSWTWKVLWRMNTFQKQIWNRLLFIAEQRSRQTQCLVRKHCGFRQWFELKWLVFVGGSWKCPFQIKSILDPGTRSRENTRKKCFRMIWDWFIYFGVYLDRENRYTYHFKRRNAITTTLADADERNVLLTRKKLKATTPVKRHSGLSGERQCSVVSLFCMQTRLPAPWM